MTRTLGRIAIVTSLLILVALGVTFHRFGLSDRLPSRAEAPEAGAPRAQTDTEADGDTLLFHGSLQVHSPQPAVLAAGGSVADVLVEVGMQVEAGDELVRLDPTGLDREVARAEIGLEMARVALLEQGEQSSAGQLAIAEANLSLAEAELTRLQIGIAEEEMAAAQSSANAAWARYNELRAGPSPARLNQLRASMEKAQVAVTQAQRAYDEIAWRGDVGRTPQAAALQRATIDLDAATAAYEEATSPPAQSELQSALAAAQRAQHSLNQLEAWPPQAEIALAEARVEAAAAAVQRVRELAGSGSLRTAELRVQQALLDLEESQARRDSASVRAPISGTVLAVNVEAGQQVGPGTIVASIGDIGRLRLVVQVPHDQVDAIAVGAPATITIFDSKEPVIGARVTQISPLASAGTGISSFPVTFDVDRVEDAVFRPGVFVSVALDEK